MTTESATSRLHHGPTDRATDGLDAIIAAVFDGDASAWPELVSQTRPLVARLVARRAPRLDEDGHSDVFVRILDRLSRNQHRALARYLETRDRYPELDFVAYLAAIVASCLVDHVRARHDRVRQRQDNARKLMPVALTSIELIGEQAAPRIDIERMLDIKRMLSELTDIRFPTGQRRALLLWLNGCDAGDIAAELELEDPAAATRLLRAARARLRRALRSDS